MVIAFSEHLDDLLGTSIAELDIPDHLHELAARRYEHLGSSLCGDGVPGQGMDCEIHTQGSFRLGTVTQPIDPKSDYDIDLVCLRNLSKESTTQLGLKTEVGKHVIAYCATRPEGLPDFDEGKRCWTLLYPTDPFHMDVLPAIPDEDGRANAILLTDKDLKNWQRSNPIEYAKWFHKTMEREFLEARIKLARVLKAADVEHVPAWKVKTTLQRSVQALKRHRDIFFINDPDLRPASIIITSLASRAYSGSGSMFEVLVDVSDKMPRLVEDINGSWMIPNPVQEKENFADRWVDRPDKAQAFFDWIEQAHRDFQDYAKDHGIHKILERVAKTLGSAPARKAGAVFGSGLEAARVAGNLRMADQTGHLQHGVGRPVQDHTFHGDAPIQSA